MSKWTEFDDFEEARLQAGLFFKQLISELEISERTYYRWKRNGRAPHWAMRIVELLSGDLAAFGWPEWELKNGLLFNKSLSSRYCWKPAEVVITAYCQCPAHQEIRKLRFGEAANDAQMIPTDHFTTTGNSTFRDISLERD